MTKVFCDMKQCEDCKDGVCQREEIDLGQPGYFGEMQIDMIKCFEKEEDEQDGDGI